MSQQNQQRNQRARNRLVMLARRFAADECGSLLSVEMILMATIVILGSIVGLASLRDSIVQEFGDAAAGMAELNQGYSFDEVRQSDQFDKMHFDFSISGSTYVDNTNFCEPDNTDPANQPPMCMTITASNIVDENQPVPDPTR